MCRGGQRWCSIGRVEQVRDRKREREREKERERAREREREGRVGRGGGVSDALVHQRHLLGKVFFI